MSRLSGFIGTLDGEEVFAITWKNYLEIDSFIWGFCFDNHLVGDKSIDDENISLEFNDYESFKQLCIALDQRIRKGFTIDDIMSHSVEDATFAWNSIIEKIFDFLDYHADGYLEQIIFEFFSCV